MGASYTALRHEMERIADLSERWTDCLVSQINEIARAALKANAGGDAIPAGEVERPFAHCCAEAGGRVEACDCVNKNHGTAWFSTPKPPAGGDAETKGWDHRYRPLAWGEVILDTDECRRDDGTWVTGICVGGKAPDPAYTSHRVYRRLVAPAGGDAGADRRYELAVALFQARYGARLMFWSDETRDYWLKRADAALALPAPVVEGDAETVPGRVGWHTSEEGGGPDVGISVGLGNGSALWIGELLDRDGGPVGIVFHGLGGVRHAARLSELDEVRDLFEHHVAPAIAALSEGRSHG